MSTWFACPLAAFDKPLLYRRLRSLSTGVYRSNSGGMGAKKRAGGY